LIDDIVYMSQNFETFKK